MWVIVYHQSSYLSAAYHIPDPILNIMRSGHVAVGIFFLLSGFILAYNYDLSGWSRKMTKKFSIARFARIYPVYLFGILCLAPFWIKTMLRAPLEQSSMASLHFAMLQSWFPLDSWHWNTPSWSISNEVFFYLLFPFVGAILWKYVDSDRKNWALIGVCWAAAMAAPILALKLGVSGAEAPATDDQYRSWAMNMVRFNPALRFPEFAAGILACKLYLRMKSTWEGRGYWFYLPPLVLSLAFIALLADKIPFIVLTNGLLLPLTALFLVGLALDGGWLPRSLSIAPIVFLGGASYSMYLIHAPVRIWMLKFHIHFLDTWMGNAFYVALSIAIASLLFKFYEEPANHWLREKLSSPSTERADAPTPVPTLSAPTPRVRDVVPGRVPSTSESTRIA
jgi:peptidoglycan/LPS O-acetylase OafA/YrhL